MGYAFVPRLQHRGVSRAGRGRAQPNAAERRDEGGLAEWTQISLFGLGRRLEDLDPELFQLLRSDL